MLAGGNGGRSLVSGGESNPGLRGDERTRETSVRDQSSSWINLILLVDTLFTVGEVVDERLVSVVSCQKGEVTFVHPICCCPTTPDMRRGGTPSVPAALHAGSGARFSRQVGGNPPAGLLRDIS